jgi:glycerol-3-phosphate dehydrogenase (NAD(P)+)
MAKISVIGCGAWGVTVAKVFCENKHETKVWCHDEQIAQKLNKDKIHPNLPNIKLPKELVAISDLQEAIESAEYLVFAVASNYVDVVTKIKPYFKAKVPILVLTKGLVEKENCLFVSDYLQVKLEQNIKLAVLSGPNLALEIALKQPAATVIAADDLKIAESFQKLISNNYFRAYTSTDLKGVELGGILKNAIAIAGGIIDGLGMGNNTKSALMTRGLVEMIRMGNHFGAKKETFYGLSGLGDLITTCTSDKSRNWNAGYNLAKQLNKTNLEKADMQIAEGIKTAKIINNLAKKNNIEMPIISEIYKVIYEKKEPLKAISDLMQRELKKE